MAAVNPEEYAQELPGVVQLLLQDVKPFQCDIQEARLHDATLSFVRCDYDHACEHGINILANFYSQLHIIYLSMRAYFDRDNVALPNIAKHFVSLSKRAHTDTLHFLDYNNPRGARAMVKTIPPPSPEFYDESKKDDALPAFQLSLALEKLAFQKLKELHDVALEQKDPEMQDFVKTKLHQQVHHIREAGNYVAELERIGRGHAVYHFDKRIGKRFGDVLSAKVELPS